MVVVGESSSSRPSRVWDVASAPLGPGQVAAVMAYEAMPDMNNLKPYSLRNGKPEEIEPYLLTAAIPAVYHWVPINGMVPTQAMKCIDGFIRCYMYKLESNPPVNSTAPQRRKMAMILGVCRAVMTVNFDLLPGDINAQEIAPPLLAVSFPELGLPVYTTLISGTSPNAEWLTNSLDFTEDELEVVKVLARCAQGIIPVQGLNLITDGHHYLSEKSKQSFKAFQAIERQVWVKPQFKTWIQNDEEVIRDVMWHKAGHPVSVVLKENAATDLNVKTNLEAAKLGSAAARLPALDSDLRAADTYLKLSEAVGAIWATMGGSVECEVLRYRVIAVKSMVRTTGTFAQPFNMAAGVMVGSRADAIALLKNTVEKNSDKAALLYGFYCAMLESTGGDMAGGVSDTLRSAFSLKKLRANNIASYLIGTEVYKDFRAMKQAARRDPERKMPKFTLED